MKAVSAVTAALGAAVLLAWFGPVLDQYSAARAVEADKEAAIKTAKETHRFERAAQAMCGPQAAWQLLGDGAVQCLNKYGHKTVIAKVTP